MALWAAFAVAAVGVGFGAAGLVGGPFSDGVADAAPAAGRDRASTSADEVPGLLPLSSASATAEATRQTEAPDPGSSSTRAPTSRSGRSGPSPSTEPARAVTRSITTRGGLVSATCRSGLVRVSGSPVVGWEIEDSDGEAQRAARVRFERPDGNGRVEVGATCSRGAPQFSLDDEDGGVDEDDAGGGEPDGGEDPGGD